MIPAGDEPIVDEEPDGEVEGDEVIVVDDGDDPENPDLM